jgi:hypothetical protein
VGIFRRGLVHSVVEGSSLMFELIFRDRETGYVNYAVTGITLIRHVTPSEVGFTDKDGHIRSSSFTQTENLEIVRLPK